LSGSDDIGKLPLPAIVLEKAKEAPRLLAQCPIAERDANLTKKQMWARVLKTHMAYGF